MGRGEEIWYQCEKERAGKTARGRTGGNEGGRERDACARPFFYIFTLCEWLTGAVLFGSDMKKIVSAKLTHKHARLNVIVVSFICATCCARRQALPALGCAKKKWQKKYPFVFYISLCGTNPPAIRRH